jgi:hypothetical protein
LNKTSPQALSKGEGLRFNTDLSFGALLKIFWVIVASAQALSKGEGLRFNTDLSFGALLKNFWVIVKNYKRFAIARGIVAVELARQDDGIRFFDW